MTTQVTVASTKGEVGMTIPAAAKVQEGLVAPARELNEADPIEPTPMAVPIDRILEYDRNPRRERNEAYVEIETSIRRRGFVGTLPITRRPGEPHYRVAEGGNTVLRILKDLYETTQDPRFHTLQCLFEPWVSESETLIAHLVENDARGELLFIDRARAVRELRDLIEQETGAPISATRFAALLRERGYSIDQPTVSRLDYAIETLFPLIPAALRSGVGRPAIDRIRKLDKFLVTFLEDRRSDQTVIDKARAWFLACLGRHDREDWRIDPVQDELEAHLAEICGESAGKVRADLDFIERYGAAGSDAPVPLTFDPPEPGPTSSRAPSPGASTVDEQATGAEIGGSPRIAVAGGHDHEAFDTGEDTPGEQAAVRRPAPEIPGAAGQRPRATDLPQDVKSLRGRMWTLASQLAQRHGLGECILTCVRGCGFLVDFPEQPPFAGPGPESAEEALRVMLWWMLAGLADEWPQGPGVAPALPLLEDTRIYPAIKAVAEGDEITPTRTLVPRVGYPPSLAIAPRELLAVLDVRDYERLIHLIDARRALQAHCRRIGKHGVWQL